MLATATATIVRDGVRRYGTAPTLDTLAQLDHERSFTNDSTASNSEGKSLRRTLQKRARAKHLSTALAVHLAEHAKAVQSPLERSYRNTAYCCAELDQESGKLRGKYCGARWCIVCGRIRTARGIDRYSSTLETWQDKQLVTLTVQNVDAQELRNTIDAMTRALVAIVRASRRSRGAERVIVRAVRKLECTYNVNARAGKYHPHFHLIVEGDRAARYLVAEWLRRHPDTANAKAQDVRPCSDDGARELFKYVTKLVTKSRMTPAAALDVIFQAMKGRRVFQSVGFVVPKDKPDEDAEQLDPVEATTALTRHADKIRWNWDQCAADWIDYKTGECLTGYEPSVWMLQVVAGMYEQSGEL